MEADAPCNATLSVVPLFCLSLVVHSFVFFCIPLAAVAISFASDSCFLSAYSKYNATIC